MALFNVFSDPKLAARQQTLDAQWDSLRATYSTCDNTPDSAFPEFTGDYNAWKQFFDSGSDWSADSANATNVWQAKAKEWADKLTGWGCTGNFSSIVQVDGASGIPGVKEPPQDSKDWVTRGTEAAGGLVGGVKDTIATIGWVAVGLVVLILVALVYAITRVRVSTPQGSVN